MKVSGACQGALQDAVNELLLLLRSKRSREISNDLRQCHGVDCKPARAEDYNLSGIPTLASPIVENTSHTEMKSSALAVGSIVRSPYPTVLLLIVVR
mmetsp:Transcript_6582/g.28108  ORF Transcript_6582/g.28108 Transcript_6582/m.28108 type:complete len:97 (-) Transcript_6582:1137-1427(-)